MQTEHEIARIYQHGFKPDDFNELQPGLIVVEPVRPPQTTLGGIVTAEEWHKMPAPRCVLHRVVQVGPFDELCDVPQLRVSVGNVVVVRTSQAEPVHPQLEPLLVHCRHVLAIVN